MGMFCVYCMQRWAQIHQNVFKIKGIFQVRDPSESTYKKTMYELDFL